MARLEDPFSYLQSNPVAYRYYGLLKSADEGCLGDVTPCHILDISVSSSCGVRFGRGERDCCGRHCLWKILSTYQNGSTRRSKHPTPKADFEKQYWGFLVAWIVRTWVNIAWHLLTEFLQQNLSCLGKEVSGRLMNAAVNSRLLMRWEMTFLLMGQVAQNRNPPTPSHPFLFCWYTQ